MAPGCPARAPEAAAAGSSLEVVRSAGDLPRVDRARLLAEARRGQGLTVVNFWATWCAPCIAELPVLDAFFQQHRSRGLQMVGVALEDLTERHQLIQSVLDSSPVGFPMVVAEPPAHAALFAGVGTAWDGSLPATWVLGADGDTLDFITGSIDQPSLDRIASRFAP